MLTFRDPDGLRLALVETPGLSPDEPLGGIGAVTLDLAATAPTERILVDILGFRRIGEERGRIRLQVPDGSPDPGTTVDLRAFPGAPRAGLGRGSVHHVAFRAADDATQRLMAERLRLVGVPTTGQKDRCYFRSIYFREPGGVLFEIATDGPGFAVDEAPDALGTSLRLPPFLEPERARIEAALPPLPDPTRA